MHLIIGLGNPGKNYENTRHNLGFMVVDALARKFSIFPGLAFGSPRAGNFQFSKNTKSNSEVLKVKSNGEELILAKPQTMMNASGYAVAKLTRRYSLDASRLWIVHDDVDLPLGKLKIVKGKGSAGHQGVRSIIEHLGTVDFVRFRLGIGRPEKSSKFKVQSSKFAEKYVLAPFLPTEMDEVRRLIKKTVEAIEIAFEEGLEKAMNRFN